MIQIILLCNFVLSFCFSFPLGILKDKLDCFIAYVVSPNYTDVSLSAKYFHSIDQNSLSTFTIYSTLELDLDVDSAITLVAPSPSLETKYLRYKSRFRSTCQIFILFVYTLEETVTVIYSSGYATSTSVIFFIHVPNLLVTNPLIREFLNMLDHEGMDEVKLIHAPLIYFSGEDNQFAVHCYFCRVQQTLQKMRNPSRAILLTEYRKLNGQGYGRRVKLLDPAQLSGFSNSNCLNTSESLERRDLYKLTFNCWFQELFFIAPLQNALNMSFILDERSPIPVPLWDKKVGWWLEIQADMVNPYIDGFAFIRGSYLHIGDLPTTFIGCVERGDTEVFTFYFDKVTTVQISGWSFLFLVIFSYAFIYKSIEKGLDLAWIFFGLQVWFKHPKKVIWFYFLWMTFISWTYQACLSSESMQLVGFPSLSTFLKNEYRIWFPESYWREEFRMMVKFLKHIKYGRQTADALNPYLESRPYTEYIYVGRGDPNTDAFQSVLDMVTYKIIAFSFYWKELYAVIKRNLMYVRGKYLCKILIHKDEVVSSSTVYLKVSGYASSRFACAAEQLVETGFLERGYRFRVANAARQMGVLGLEPVHAFLQPDPISLFSSVGVACVGLLGILLAILLCNICKRWMENDSFMRCKENSTSNVFSAVVNWFEKCLCKRSTEVIAFQLGEIVW